jgi:hypothetical protein
MVLTRFPLNQVSAWKSVWGQGMRSVKHGEFIWAGVLGCTVAALLYPPSHAAIMNLTQSHPYWMGFAKFSILASLGELLAIRLAGGEWAVPTGMVYRTFVWGCIGFGLVAIFPVFSNGVTAGLQSGLLPGGQFGSPLVRAIWTSALLNLASGPGLMCTHRILDTYLDLAGGRLLNLSSVRLSQVIAHIDWPNLIEVVCIKMQLFFWIPAHTVTFLLPPEYRVLCAASLSFAMGVILAFSKRQRAHGRASIPSTLAVKFGG